MGPPHPKKHSEVGAGAEKRSPFCCGRLPAYQHTSSVSDMISPLNWPSLQDRRLNCRLVMLYKIYYNLVDIDWKEYLTLHSSTTIGHSSRFIIPHTSSSAYTSSFFPRTIRNWNNLPADPAAYPSLDAFKSALRDSGLKKLHSSQPVFT